MSMFSCIVPHALKLSTIFISEFWMGIRTFSEKSGDRSIEDWKYVSSNETIDMETFDHIYQDNGQVHGCIVLLLFFVLFQSYTSFTSFRILLAMTIAHSLVNIFLHQQVYRIITLLY